MNAVKVLFGGQAYSIHAITPTSSDPKWTRSAFDTRLQRSTTSMVCAFVMDYLALLELQSATRPSKESSAGILVSTVQLAA